MGVPRALTGRVVALVALAASVWVAAVQAGGAARRTPAPGQPTSGKAEIFCESLSVGQLCLHGSVDVLKLDAEKRAKWQEAGRRYNQAVNSATKQFLGEVKAFLSPAEYARVEQWFDKAVNTYLNQRLLQGSDKP